MKPIDERDIMFARMARVANTKAYESYYTERPGHKETDDLLRSKGPMGDEKAKFYDTMYSPLVNGCFGFLSDIKGLVEGPAKSTKIIEATKEEFTEKLKEIAKLYGAKLSGVALYDSSYYYSHRGRTDEHFGEKIESGLPYTFVYAVEMEHELIKTAPKVTQSIAVTKGYIDAAIIGMVLTYWIKQLGYEARNHMDGNYLMVMPLAAKAAGLGDIGRHGLLITEEFGPRVRIGAVTTDLPLLPNTPSNFSVEVFCKSCGLCARICPAKAIDTDGNFDICWPSISQEKCYAKWQEFGSDCGICVAKCPFGTKE